MTAAVVWREEERLARHLPRRTGGRCGVWVVVHRPEALPELETRLKEEGLSRTVIGTGSRLAVRDGGLAGAVLRLGHGFAHLTSEVDTVEVGAAVPLARLGVAAGEGPLSALRGQPGSLAGSLLCDAGWAPWVVSVDVFHRGGIRTILYDELSSRRSAVVVGARLRWSVDGGRRPRVPGRSRPWSVFEEVPRADLAAVLRKGGLAGTRLRDVLLPEAEPASLANLGTASARDVELLIKSVTDRMKREQGVELKPALTWLGRVS